MEVPLVDFTYGHLILLGHKIQESLSILNLWSFQGKFPTRSEMIHVKTSMVNAIDAQSQNKTQYENI